MGTEGVADMHAGQKTGRVQKRLYQVDSDRPDVRGIPSPRNKYVGKRDIAIKKIERSKGMLQMPLTYGLTMNPPAQKFHHKICSYSTQVSFRYEDLHPINVPYSR